jgi:hypothetical protein
MKIRNAYRTLVRKPLAKHPLGRLKRKGENTELKCKGKI